MSDAVDLTPVSVEQDGRILSGVGVSAEELEKVMERHAPPEPDAPAQTPASASTPSTPPAQETAQPEPPKTRGQKRFDELTAQREAAKREAEEARRELAEAKARLDALEQARSAPAQTPQAPPQAAPQAPPQQSRPQPREDEVGTKYASYADFIVDTAKWVAEQELAAKRYVAADDFDARLRQSIEADRASRNFREHVKSVFDAGPKVYPDFDAVLSRSTVQFSPEKQQAIALAPGAEHILYALAKDDALATRLASEADPMRFGFELAKLVPAAGVASPASTLQTGSPMPPAPYQPVGSGSQTTVIPSAELTKAAGYDFDKSGYRERRAAERGVRRRR